MKAIKRNLQHQVSTNDHSILFCPNCDMEYSANLDDYFMLPDAHLFHCECGEELIIGHKKIVINSISKDKYNDTA